MMIKSREKVKVGLRNSDDDKVLKRMREERKVVMVEANSNMVIGYGICFHKGEGFEKKYGI